MLSWVQKNRAFHSVHGKYKLTQTFLEGNLTIGILKILVKCKSFDPDIALLGLYFRGINKDVHMYLYEYDSV